MRSAFQAVVSGRVHMVMYRDFAQRKASEFGLTGTVENMPDGTVMVVAEGEKEKLEKYITLLKQGPILARVDGVTVTWAEPSGRFKGFSIEY